MKISVNLYNTGIGLYHVMTYMPNNLAFKPLNDPSLSFVGIINGLERQSSCPYTFVSMRTHDRLCLFFIKILDPETFAHINRDNIYRFQATMVEKSSGDPLIKCLRSREGTPKYSRFLISIFQNGSQFPLYTCTLFQLFEQSYFRGLFFKSTRTCQYVTFHSFLFMGHCLILMNTVLCSYIQHCNLKNKEKCDKICIRSPHHSFDRC